MLAAILLMDAGIAHAHKPSDSYLTIGRRGATEMTVRWDIAVRDLEVAVGVDTNGDGRVTWGELRQAIPAARAYARSHLGIAAGGHACVVGPGDDPGLVVSHSDGAYLSQTLNFRCAAATQALSIDYALLFALDPQHRGIARLDDGTNRVLIFDADRRHLEVALARADGAGQLVSAIRSGVHHIWTGYDHLLFLLALLLPAVLRRQADGRWVGVDDLRTAGADIARVVTAFTVAHSITLTLAAVGFVSLPSRLVESLIAASVVVAAVNNLYPLLRRDRWMAAFALGLLHGFGFSATLNDAGLTGRALLKTLFGFNVGVELGQMTMVALFIPVAYSLRHKRAYRRFVLLGGSAVIAAVASLWLVERAFNISLLTR
jgi:hypothetical protein